MIDDIHDVPDPLAEAIDELERAKVRRTLDPLFAAHFDGPLPASATCDATTVMIRVGDRYYPFKAKYHPAA